MEIYFEEGMEVDQHLKDVMLKGAEKCVRDEGLDPDLAEVSVTFVGPEEIRELNRDYRGIDKVTDVLSFPQFDDFENLPDIDELCLGDVVICRERAEEQAEEYGHSYERELVYLFVHSILHLLGYDHMEEEEKKEMRGREEEVMTFLGIER